MFCKTRLYLEPEFAFLKEDLTCNRLIFFRFGGII